ncbi:MAG: phosphoribosylaminoimidazolesuccinocarboxamide synthase [Bdellovibrionota bacterium]
MLERNVIEQQLKTTLNELDLPQLGEKYRGKVRDCYVVGSQRILITSDRLSAFDRVLTTIPFKGQVLNQMASYWFRETRHLVPNHIIAEPHPNVFVGREAKILPVEVIVRGYLTGSAWRDYQAGKAISGITLPKGLKKSARFETPLITPSTKAEHGVHDEPISSEEIVRTGLVEKKLWEETCDAALRLFAFGTKRAAENGLILVDTKYEFGVAPGANGKPELIVADEIHTSDSSRYWVLSSYDDAYASGQDPVMLDKEFVRGWLMKQGYMGDGTPPAFPDAFRVDTAIKYIEAFERITGKQFEGLPGNPQEAIKRALADFLG